MQCNAIGRACPAAGRGLVRLGGLERASGQLHLPPGDLQAEDLEQFRHLKNDHSYLSPLE